MQFCEHCHVSVAGSHRRCPLCQGPLTGAPDPGEDVFPVLAEDRHRLRLFLRLGAFGTIAAALICLAVNFMFPTGVWWAGFVAAGLTSVWLLVIIALRKRHNIPKTILWLVVLGGLLGLFWDRCTGWHGWGFSYVIPILCSGAMLALMILPRLLRLRLSDYLFYLAIDILFGSLPVVFYLTGLLGDTLAPSLICVCISAHSLSAVLVFQGRELVGEISRCMHL